MLLLRRRLLQTAVSRGLVLGLLCCALGMLVNRAMQLIPASGPAATVSSDQLLAATSAAATFVRWPLLLTPIFLVGALISRLAPDLAGESMALNLGLALVIALFAHWRDGASEGTEATPAAPVREAPPH